MGGRRTEQKRDFMTYGNNIKSSNIWVIGILEGKHRENEAGEKIVEGIIAENLPNL